MRFLIGILLLVDFYTMAEREYYSNNYPEAIRISLEGLSTPGITDDSAVELYSILGSSYARLGAFDKAADYMVRCYEYDLAHGESEGLTSSLINLASMYVYAGEADMAEQYALLAVKNEESIGRDDKMAMALGKVCDVYHAQGRDSLALVYATKAVEIAREKLPLQAQAIRRSQRAYPLVALGRYQEALVDLLFAEDIFRSEGNRQSLSIVCFQLAQEYARRGDKVRERNYLREAANLTRELHDLPMLQKVENSLAQSLSKDNPAEALEHMKTASALADSIARTKSDHALELYNIEFFRNKSYWIRVSQTNSLQITIDRSTAVARILNRTILKCWIVSVRLQTAAYDIIVVIECTANGFLFLIS